jgi:hypothetical protein
MLIGIKEKYCDDASGRGTIDKPIIIPRALSVSPLFEAGTGSITKMRWSFSFVDPPQAIASKYPWRAYGLDGAADNPKICIPELKDETGTQVGKVAINCWTIEDPLNVVSRVFYVRNATPAEKKEMKDERWVILSRELGKYPRGVHCSDGTNITTDLVFIKLAQELRKGGFYQNMFGNWFSMVGAAGTQAILDSTQEYLLAKLENPDYTEEIDDSGTETETEPEEKQDTETDTDSDGSESGDSDTGSGDDDNGYDFDVEILMSNS